MEIRKRVWIVFAILIVLPNLASAGDPDLKNDDWSCSCGKRNESTVEMPPPVVDKAVPSMECLPYLDAQRNEDKRNCKNSVTCGGTDEEWARLREDNDRLVALMKQSAHDMKGASVPAAFPTNQHSDTVLIRNVRVKRGWNVSRIVERYQAERADLDATLSCNEFDRRTVIYPAQKIKVCRYK